MVQIMTKERKLDIKNVLYNIDNKNINWFSTLTEEQKDGFSPYVVMQFLNGGNSEESLELTNMVLNSNFSSKSKDKELFYRLACVIGTGRKAYHPYTKPPKVSKTRSNSIYVKLLTEYTQETVTEQEAIIIYNKNKKFYNDDYWVMIAESLGWDNDSVKKLKAEIKTIV